MPPTTMRIIPYFLYLFLIGFYQVVLMEPLMIWGVWIALAPLMVSLVAIYKSQVTAVWFAAGAMFVVNAGDVAASSLQMIVATLVALGIGRYKDHLNLESLPARLALVVAGCFILELVRVTLVTGDGLFFTYLRYMLPSILYTGLVAVLFFLIKDDVISYQKLKRMF